MIKAMSTSTAKDFHRCLRNLHRFTDGQVTVVEWDVGVLSTLVIDVTPNDGLYEGGQFRFQIAVTVGVPKVTCLTNIYHPNIDPGSWTDDDGNVCLNIFNEWPPSYGLQDCVQGIMFLFHNPNLDDPLAPYFENNYYKKEEFPEKVRSSLRGEEVDGFTFGEIIAATGTTTSTAAQPDDRKLDDTFGLENIFASTTSTAPQPDDRKLDGTFGLENISATTTSTTPQPDDRELDGTFGLENISATTTSNAPQLDDRELDDTFGLENISATKTSNVPQPDDRELDGTFGLENIFADQKQDVALDEENVFAEQKQEDVVCAEKVSAKQTEENVIGHENICAGQNQEDVVGLEKICVGQYQEFQGSLENAYADGETVVDMADGAAVEQTHLTAEGRPLVEECRHLIVIPSSHVILRQPHANRAGVTLVCKHSCQTVTRRLFRLLGVAATRVRYWFSSTQRQPVERSNCYECTV